MKKYISTIIFTFFSLITFSQINVDSTKHIAFKGVPINGTLTEYVLKMKNSGFIHKGTSDGIAVLEGDFAGYKNCLVEVSTLKQKDLVSNIAVMFTTQDTWAALSGNYFNLKELLIEKYGNPAECVEEFQSYIPKDDRSKMMQVKLDAYKYYTTFKMGNGTINLSIENKNFNKVFVRLAYFDKINSEVMRKEALEDL